MIPRFFRKRSEEEEMEDLSSRIAKFWYDIDPYEFVDNMDTGDTLDEAVEKLADNIYDEMVEGHFDHLIKMLRDVDTCGDSKLVEDKLSILEDLNFMRMKSSPIGSKNILEPIRRRKR